MSNATTPVKHKANKFFNYILKTTTIWNLSWIFYLRSNHFNGKMLLFGTSSNNQDYDGNRKLL